MQRSRTGSLSTAVILTALVIPFVTRKKVYLALLILLIFPVAAEVLVSLIRPIFYGRTFIYILAPLFLLAALAIRKLPRMAAIAVAVLLCATFIPGLLQIHALDEKEDWRNVHALLEGSRKDEMIVVNPGYLDASAVYYARDLPPGEWRKRLLLVDADTIHVPSVPMAQARLIAANAPGVWLITRYEQDDGWTEFLEGTFPEQLTIHSGNVNVTHFSR